MLPSAVAKEDEPLGCGEKGMLWVACASSWVHAASHNVSSVTAARYWDHSRLCCTATNTSSSVGTPRSTALSHVLWVSMGSARQISSRAGALGMKMASTRVSAVRLCEYM